MKFSASLFSQILQIMPRSSFMSSLGRVPLKDEITGPNLVCAIYHEQYEQGEQ
jgi:hypothetical protein